MTASDPGMYGSAAARARDLLYEVQGWIDDAELGRVDVGAMVDALYGRLGPAGDAAVDEARELRSDLDACRTWQAKRVVALSQDPTCVKWMRESERLGEAVARVEALCDEAEGSVEHEVNGRLWTMRVRAALADPAPGGAPSVPTPICSSHDRALTFRPTDWSDWQICAKCGAVVRDEAKPC